MQIRGPGTDYKATWPARDAARVEPRLDEQIKGSKSASAQGPRATDAGFDAYMSPVSTSCADDHLATYTKGDEKDGHLRSVEVPRGVEDPRRPPAARILRSDHHYECVGAPVRADAPFAGGLRALRRGAGGRRESRGIIPTLPHRQRVSLGLLFAGSRSGHAIAAGWNNHLRTDRCSRGGVLRPFLIARRLARSRSRWILRALPRHRYFAASVALSS